MSNTKYGWLRWILVLPVAAIALFLGEAFLRLLNYLNSWFFGFSESSPYMVLSNLFATGFGGFLCIALGTSTAPGHRKTTGFVSTPFFRQN